MSGCEGVMGDFLAVGVYFMFCEVLRASVVSFCVFVNSWWGAWGTDEIEMSAGRFNEWRQAGRPVVSY